MTPYICLNIKNDIVFAKDQIKELIQESGNNDRHKYQYTNHVQDNSVASIKFYELDADVKNIVLSKLPANVLNLEKPNVYYMEVDNTNDNAMYLPPHVDRGRRSAINFYVDCNDEKTNFYKNIGGNLVDQGSFVAKSKDVWMLDVSQPHSVKFANKHKRKAITLSFKKLKFNTLANLMGDLLC